MAMANVDLIASRPQRVAVAGSRLADTRERWQVLYSQLRSGHEPCYQTEQRLVCTEYDCHWRTNCLALRAEWLR